MSFALQFLISSWYYISDFWKRLSAYGIKAGETLIIIVNAYGINAVTIDAALEAKRLGPKTIGITSTSFAISAPKNAKMRHSSGKNLHELVDVFVDSHLPYGDACVLIDGCEQAVSLAWTILNSYCLNLLVIATVEKLLTKAIEPPLLMSANLTEGDTKTRSGMINRVSWKTSKILYNMILYAMLSS